MVTLQMDLAKAEMLDFKLVAVVQMVLAQVEVEIVQFIAKLVVLPTV
jgi:hypothetical protein